MGLTTLSRKKNVVQKPNNQPKKTGCQGGQGSSRAVAPSEEDLEPVFYFIQWTVMIGF
jgi:hypothetical protein